jgi:hypothetical protein
MGQIGVSTELLRKKAFLSIYISSHHRAISFFGRIASRARAASSISSRTRVREAELHKWRCRVYRRRLQFLHHISCYVHMLVSFILEGLWGSACKQKVVFPLPNSPMFLFTAVMTSPPSYKNYKCR